MNIRTDLHTHTLYSRHAYSTLEENIRAAVKRGLELLGSTDHFSGMLFPDQEEFKNYQFFINQRCWPREWHGVRLLRGFEADLTDLEGHLFGQDIPVRPSIVKSPGMPTRPLYDVLVGDMDYVIASVHGTDFTRGADKSQLTDMYIKAMDQPKVKILGHIGRSGLDIEVRSIVEAARDKGKLIEINEHSFGADQEVYVSCRHVAEECALAGCSIAVSTDAHIAYDIGRFERSISLLEEIGFPEELVANRSAESLAAFLPVSAGENSAV